MSDHSQDGGGAVNPLISTLKPGATIINATDEDPMEIYGYKPNLAKTLLTWTFILLTVGMLRLVFHWRPQWMLACTHTKCSLDEAKKVLLVDIYAQQFTERVVHLHQRDWIMVPGEGGAFDAVNDVRYFDNKKVRYIWDTRKGVFSKLRGLDTNIKCTYFYDQKGLASDEQKRRQTMFGRNAIEVEVQSILIIFLTQAIGPFYIFQIYSIILWSLDYYYYYASCIFVMSALSLSTSVYQTRKNQVALRDTVQGSDPVSVSRAGERYETIDSTYLQPGDIIEIPALGGVMQCDAVLIAGNAIVNESMLTGESVPVTKTPLPHTSVNMIYDPSKEHGKHTLFCGTHVIQTRSYGANAKVRAVVIRTGFQTAKGELVRSIMFPKPVDFKLNGHISKFMMVLASLAVMGFIYTVILKTRRGVEWSEILLKALDLITIVVPGTLPAGLTIGIVYAQSRLRKSDIFCISPRAINISGCINAVCFDKTGTLTEDDLNFCEVVPVDAGTHNLGQPIQHPSSELPSESPMLVNLAVCHSLTLLSEKIIGDPLDQKMFAASGWHMEEPDHSDLLEVPGQEVVQLIVLPENGGSEVNVLRQFPFSSSLQRMSVIVKRPGLDNNNNSTSYELHAKGAPEMIQSLCDRASVPHDFSARLHAYTEKGYRVLALANRQLPSDYGQIHKASREDLEQRLHFLGLLVMGNMLKPETTPVIQELIRANIRPIMVTGDNMLTALSVARECSMVKPTDKVILLEDDASHKDESAQPQIYWKYATATATGPIEPEFIGQNFAVLKDVESRSAENSLHIAVAGKTFKVLRKYYPDLLAKVAVRGTVFARMAPEQKQQLIELLQELGYFVGMCGDGANDCGALKAAHAGISLSEAEASVASPFTSKRPNISCVPTLIREGRASITTAFGILKYCVLGSLTQFISVIIVYTYFSNFTDNEFLYTDLFLVTLFIIFFGRNHAHKELDTRPPPSSLMGLVPLASITCQILLVVLTQVLSIVFIRMQSWYVGNESEDDSDIASVDNFALFVVVAFQYVTLAVVFSKGAPYRTNIYKNRPFSFVLILMSLITAYMVIYPADWLINVMKFAVLGVPVDFRVFMVLLALAHFFIANFCEMFFVDFILFRKFHDWFPRMMSDNLEYQRLDEETRNSTRWLPEPSAAAPGRKSIVAGIDLSEKLEKQGRRSSRL